MEGIRGVITRRLNFEMCLERKDNPQYRQRLLNHIKEDIVDSLEESIIEDELEVAINHTLEYAYRPEIEKYKKRILEIQTIDKL